MTTMGAARGDATRICRSAGSGGETGQGFRTPAPEDGVVTNGSTTVEIRRPEARACERCGRREEWAGGTWRVRETGDCFCVHEWDINGSFVPFRFSDGESDDADD